MSAESFTIGSEDIQLVDIDAALKELATSDPKLCHAALFTLVLSTQKGARDYYFQKSIDAVISKFPGRTIIITRDHRGAKSANYIRTHVSSTPIPPSLFCEKIHIEVGGECEERVPSIVLPHLLADLPLYLIWSGPLPLNHPLLPLTKRLIIDTEISDDIKGGAEVALRLMQSLKCGLADLAWRAFKGWRSIFCTVYREKSELEELQSATQITLTFLKNPSAIQANPWVRAAYLQAWIANSCNWQFKQIEQKQEQLILTYTSRASSMKPQEHRIVLIPKAVQVALPTGALLSIEVRNDHINSQRTFVRNQDKPQVFCQYSDTRLCELPTFLALAGPKEGEEIIEELFYPSDTTAYKKALQLVATIPWPQV